MGVVISRDSELGKELARWDTPRNKPVLDSSGDPVRMSNGQVMMGMNCVGVEEYPKMLYKAQTHNGKVLVSMPMPHPMHFTTVNEYEQACLWAESFSRSCQKIVTSEQEERIAKGQGWSVTQQDALDLYEAQQQEFAQLAAEAIFQSKRMTEKAQAEFSAAEAQTSKHVVDVKGTKQGPKGITGDKD